MSMTRAWMEAAVNNSGNWDMESKQIINARSICGCEGSCGS